MKFKIVIITLLISLGLQAQDLTGIVRMTRVMLQATDTTAYVPIVKQRAGGRIVEADWSMFGGGGGGGGSCSFTPEQCEALAALIYRNSISSISVLPTAGERGVSTAITLTYNITSNQDVYTAASINQGIGSVLSNVNAGNVTISGGNKSNTTAYTLSMTYTRNGVSANESKTATYTTYVPQWIGVSTVTDFTTYAGITAAGLEKFVQASPSLQKIVNPSAQYVYLISNNAAARVYDGNNFLQTSGAFGDGISEFYTRSFSLTLADGTTTGTVYLYRSRNLKTLTNITYKLAIPN